jgi:transcriptional regulator with XRE-family HTH domain
MARARRDLLVRQGYARGATQAELASRLGLSPSGISRILARLDARPDAAELRVRAAARATAHWPRPIWPDCPPHLAREYQRIRAIIGSRAARDQLLSIEARARASVPFPTSGSLT